MITSQKLKVISIFMHSRLEGSYSEIATRCELNEEEKIEMLEDDEPIYVIEDIAKRKYIEKEMKELKESLSSQNLTILYLNEMPDNYFKREMIYYYNICLKAMERYLPHGSLVQENVIVLSLLCHILIEKNIGRSDKSPIELLSYYEEIYKKKDDDSKRVAAVVKKMMLTADAIIKSLDNANFAKFLRSKRKKAKR